MKNIIEGFATTAIGFAGMVITVLYFYGLIPLPSGFVPKAAEIGVAFGVSLILFLVPRGKLEEMVLQLWNKFFGK